MPRRVRAPKACRWKYKKGDGIPQRGVVREWDLTSSRPPPLVSFTQIKLQYVTTEMSQ